MNRIARRKHLRFVGQFNFQENAAVLGDGIDLTFNAQAHQLGNGQVCLPRNRFDNFFQFRVKPYPDLPDFLCFSHHP